MTSKDLKTKGIVLRRTNYGEADRILNMITPVGKISAIAKGVRRQKSKLAGGVEMFTLADLVVHLGRGELGIITSAKMIKSYGMIIQDYGKMELAAKIMKQISAAAEQIESAEYFEVMKQCLEELNQTTDAELVKGWFLLNMMRIKGEEVNLYRDTKGQKLDAEKKYEWNVLEAAFDEKSNGTYGANEIKMLRLMTKMNLATVKKIKTEPEVLDKVYDIMRVWEN